MAIPLRHKCGKPLLVASLVVLILTISVSDLFHDHHYCLPDLNEHFGGCGHECPVHVLQSGIVGAAITTAPDLSFTIQREFLTAERTSEPDWEYYHDCPGRSPPA